MGFEVAGAPRRRRRRWIGAVVAAWILVLGLLSWWSIDNDPATVPEQRDLEQAMPALRTAAGTLLAAADRVSAADGRWAVRLGAVRTEKCELTPVRNGVNAGRDVFLYVPEGRARDALDQVAAALPGGYRAGVVALRVGTRLSLYADAGDFIAVEAQAQAADQVLVLSVDTGCRPGTAAGGSDPAAGAVPATLSRTVTALGGPAGATVTTQVVACPGGGTAATYQATAGRGRPAGSAGRGDAGVVRGGRLGVPHRPGICCRCRRRREPAGQRDDPLRSVDEGPRALGHDLLDEDGRAGDPDARDDVVRADAAAGHALRARGDPAGLEQHLDQVGQRGGVRQGELGGPAGQGEPRRLAGQPERHVHPRGHGRGRHVEGLVAALRGVRSGGGLDDQQTCHSGQHKMGRSWLQRSGS
jgi:hypothetical protein